MSTKHSHVVSSNRTLVKTVFDREFNNQGHLQKKIFTKDRFTLMQKAEGIWQQGGGRCLTGVAVPD